VALRAGHHTEPVFSASIDIDGEPIVFKELERVRLNVTQVIRCCAGAPVCNTLAASRRIQRFRTDG
jgi:hypothetical protein